MVGRAIGEGRRNPLGSATSAVGVRSSRRSGASRSHVARPGMPPRDGGRGSRRTTTAEVEGRRRASDGAARDEGNGDASDAAATRVANLCPAFRRASFAWDAWRRCEMMMVSYLRVVCVAKKGKKEGHVGFTIRA